MTKRELVIELSRVYVEGFKRECEIEHALSQFDIYVEDEGHDSMLGRVEKILNNINDYLVDYLLDFAERGYAEYWTGDKEGEGEHVILSTIEDIIKDFVIE